MSIENRESRCKSWSLEAWSFRAILYPDSFRKEFFSFLSKRANRWQCLKIKIYEWWFLIRIFVSLNINDLNTFLNWNKYSMSATSWEICFYLYNQWQWAEIEEWRLTLSDISNMSIVFYFLVWAHCWLTLTSNISGIGLRSILKLFSKNVIFKLQ